MKPNTLTQCCPTCGAPIKRPAPEPTPTELTINGRAQQNGGDHWQFKLWKEKFQIGDDVIARVRFARFDAWIEGQVIGHTGSGYPLVRCGDRVVACGRKWVKHFFEWR